MKRILFLLTIFISVFAQSQYLNQPAKWNFLYPQKYNTSHQLFNDSSLISKLYCDSVVSLKLSTATAAGTYMPLAGGTFTGHVLATDNTYDLGASGANRFRTGNFGTSVVTPSATISNMTLGSMLFAGTGGIVSQDNANLFWDNTNKRLAIGQSSALSILDISSSAVGVSSGIIVRNTSNNNSAYSGATFYNDGGKIGQFFMTSSTYNLASSIGANSAGFYTDGANGISNIAVNGPIKFITGGSSVEKWRVSNGGNLSSTNSDGSAKLHVLSTTEQIRTAYDASNYESKTVNITGSVTYALTGTSPTFTFSNDVNLTGKIVKYNNITTVGNGIPSIYGTGRSTAQTAAVASVATYTVAASDASFQVSANVNVTTSSAENFTVTCAYTDETNTARTLTLPFSLLNGTATTTIAFAGGAVPYHGQLVHIRCKASTSITIATTGVFTGATYNVEANIIKTN